MKVDIKITYNSQHPEYSIHNRSASAEQLGLAVAGDTLKSVTELFRRKARATVREMKHLVGRSDRNEAGRVHLADTIHYRVRQTKKAAILKIWVEARHAVFVEYGTFKMQGKYFFRNAVLDNFSDIIPHYTLIRGIVPVNYNK